MSNKRTETHANTALSFISREIPEPQYEANQVAIQRCNQYYRTSDCVTYKEGYQNVYQAKIQRTEERKENLSIDNINEKVDALAKRAANLI